MRDLLIIVPSLLITIFSWITFALLVIIDTSIQLINTFYMYLSGLVLILNRYWVTEMHVDGFRFDLASILTRSSRFVARASSIHEFSLFNGESPLPLMLILQSLGCCKCIWWSG